MVYDYGVSDIKIEDDTDFDPEKPSVTRTLSLKIPVFPYALILIIENLSHSIDLSIRPQTVRQGVYPA